MNLLTILLLVLAAQFLSPSASAQATCAGNGAGEPGCASTGNPINVITGNKFQREVDLAPLPGVMGLEIVRYYNSSLSGLNSHTGILGRGWRLSYETTLAAIGDTVQVLQADGTRLIFARDLLRPSLCSSTDPANGEIDVRRTPKGDEYIWRKTDGQRLSFNHQGLLVQILAPTGEFVSMQHDARGWLVKVTDPQGRSLQLDYLEKKEAAGGTRFAGVKQIKSPVGLFSFGYGSDLPHGANQAALRQLVANLVEVGMPDGTARRYHYEDARFPTLMTGISFRGPIREGKSALRRYATYGYDANAMAVSSTHAGGVGQITLDHSVGGQTVLTNSIGEKTVYRYSMIAGSLRIHEVRGPGCARCGTVNVRYVHDEQGRTRDVTRLGPDGSALETIRTDLDHYGRPARISRIQYKNGQPGTPEWLQRFDYAPGKALKPILIARPSVVATKEYTTRIIYGETPVTRERPVQVTDEGYVPTYDGTAVSKPITRTIRYRYDGGGHRIEIDGPLANAASDPGPDNSDITRIEHDPATGLPTRTIAPGKLVSQVIERDAALRPTKVRSSDGYREQTATIRNNWRGQPELIHIEAALLRLDGKVEPGSVLTRSIEYRYDMQGKIESIIAPGRLITRFAYDAAGRLTHRVLPDGSKIAVELDTEGKTTSELRYRDGDATALASIRFHYDRNGRLVQAEDAIGMLGQSTYTAPGQVATLTNGLGISTRFAYDDNGLLVMRTQAAETSDASTTRLGYDRQGRTASITDAKGVRTDQRHDDFGRKVFESSADRGVMLYVHDEGGRMVARIDDTMATTRYRYDHAGRLVAVGTDNNPELVRYSFQGLYMVSMINTADGRSGRVVERVSNRYDALGQFVRNERWIARVDKPSGGMMKISADKAGNAGLTFITERQYDEAGRIVQQVLPDGHRLSYRYMPSRSGTGNHGAAQLNAILFDDELVVTNIDQSVAGGLTGYTHGNGVRQHIGRDQRGRIVELKATTMAASPKPTMLARWWQKIRTWCGAESEATESLIYRQVNRYDNGNRLKSIRRQFTPEPGYKGPSSTTEIVEKYEYDNLDRLLEVNINTGDTTRFAYDTNGNRISRRVGTLVDTYRYEVGTNRLKTLTAVNSDPGKQLPVAQAWLYHATGVPVMNLLRLQAESDAALIGQRRLPQRVVYNRARRPIAVFAAGSIPVANYYYNSDGERIAKSVYRQGHIVTTYSLYENQKLVSEADSEGKITAHYIYLQGKPVAKITTGLPVTRIEKLRKIGRNLEGMLMKWEFNLSDSIVRIDAVHTDHRGMPHAMSDQFAKLSWRGDSDPFGKLKVRFAAAMSSGQVVEMKLRLPGQIYDSETGLHQNYYRDYDPESGRYVTADPIGLAGGMNPYEYAGSNPLSKIDPLGLYQSDVHFYMTYFLAIVAGMGAEDARIMALATQYIDDNHDTHPVDEKNIGTIILSPTWNKENLAKYHFVLWTQKPGERAVFSKDTGTGEPLDKSPQLEALYGYARDFDPSNCSPNGISLQFMGEFLHAFQDTYAHRDPNNLPFPLNGGLGHGFYSSHPDYTYNHDSWRFGVSIKPPFMMIQDNWINNESRTLSMELAVYDQITSYMKSRSYADHPDNVGKVTGKNEEILMSALNKFNACQIDEQSAKKMTSCAGDYTFEAGDKRGMAAKVEILNQALIDLGYNERIEWSKGKNGGDSGYNVGDAAINRDKFYDGLDKDKYPASIFPKGE